MRIYESDIPFDECLQTIKNIRATKDGDIEISVQKNKIEISTKHTLDEYKIWQGLKPSQKRIPKIPVIFYGKVSSSKNHTILSGSFAITNAWKAICIFFSFFSLFSAGALLSHIIFGQVPLSNDVKRELLSNYGFALFLFLTIPLIKLTIARNDKESIILFLEKKLNFRLIKEIREFSQSDIAIIYALLIAHTSGFVLAIFI